MRYVTVRMRQIWTGETIYNSRQMSRYRIYLALLVFENVHYQEHLDLPKSFAFYTQISHWVSRKTMELQRCN